MLQTLTIVYDSIWVYGKQEIQDANMVIYQWVKYREKLQ